MPNFINLDKENFYLLIISDLDYEKMVIDLRYGSSEVATLNCDNGIDFAEIKFFDRSRAVLWTFNCKEFINFLTKNLTPLKEVEPSKDSKFQFSFGFINDQSTMILHYGLEHVATIKDHEIEIFGPCEKKPVWTFNFEDFVFWLNKAVVALQEVNIPLEQDDQETTTG